MILSNELQNINNISFLLLRALPLAQTPGFPGLPMHIPLQQNGPVPIMHISPSFAQVEGVVVPVKKIAEITFEWNHFFIDNTI